jgi:hypothetical protein
VKPRECTSRVCRFLHSLGAFNGLSGDAQDLFTEEPLSGGAEAQLESLGFVLPTQIIADYIEENASDSVVVGFISSWKDKINKRGKQYRVYRCVPNGMFWIDSGFDNIKKGDMVRIEKNAYGKAVRKQKVKVATNE